MNNTLGERIKNTHTYKAYKLYFNSRLIVFMLSLFLFHIIIMLCEIFYLMYCQMALKKRELPENNPYLMDLILSTKVINVFKTQGKLAGKWALRRAQSTFSKLIEFMIIISFFSHGIRVNLMRYTRKFKGIVQINSSHMSVQDNNFICLAFLALGMKSVLGSWIVKSSRNSVDLCMATLIEIIRCLIICPILMWLFSSVYNKTKSGLIFAGYVSIVILIFITNCTSIIPDGLEGFEKIPAKELGPGLYNELVRLKLDDRIFWDQETPSENAALVKTGASKYILVMGNLLKYGKNEFISFIAHEVGHADDYSTEKKLLASVIGLGLSCGIMIGILHIISPKYENRGVSKFSVVVFLLLANMYIFSGLTNMFYNNLYILSEVNADLYAKKLGFGRTLANGLYQLVVDNTGLLFHSTIYTYYAQDHPVIATRISYLSK
ncbi:STE24 endopeptidase [Nematocida parisii]|nr:STE24 endopeptidase [Nematocida parisii]KAI5130463.1 STE24 endopeptidase [Nematocida parisii]KAI5143103.1 STE24 endopeptidase [Nematocida parisii]